MGENPLRDLPVFGHKISLAARLLRTRFDARARSIGLTRAQWRMIATIAADEGVTQRVLASRLDINSVTAGRILDRLAAAGHIERRADPDDRRVNRVYLTPLIQPILHQLSAIGFEQDQTATAGLSEAELSQLEALLQRVVSNLRHAAALELEPDEELD